MAKPKPPFTEDQLLTELMRAPENAAGLSVIEIGEMLGHGAEWVRPKLRRLQLQGKLEVARALRPAIDGSMRPIPVYRLKG